LRRHRPNWPSGGDAYEVLGSSALAARMETAEEPATTRSATVTIARDAIARTNASAGARTGDSAATSTTSRTPRPAGVITTRYPTHQARANPPTASGNVGSGSAPRATARSHVWSP